MTTTAFPEGYIPDADDIALEQALNNAAQSPQESADDEPSSPQSGSVDEDRPEQPVADVRDSAREQELRSWQGRVEAARREQERAEQLAALQAERAENLMRQRQQELEQLKSERELRAQLERQLAEATAPKVKFEKLRGQLDEEAVKELEEVLSRQQHSGYVKADDVDRLVAEKLKEFRLQDHQMQTASKQKAFLQTINDPANGVPQLAKLSADSGFNEWLEKHPASPQSQILDIVNRHDTGGIGTIKYWVAEYEKTLPAGTNKLANAGKSASGGQAAKMNNGNGSYDDLEANVHALIQQGKYAEARKLASTIK